MKQVKTAFVRCVQFNLLDAIRENLQAVNSVSEMQATRLLVSDEMYLVLDEQSKREQRGNWFLTGKVAPEGTLDRIFGLHIVVDSTLEPGTFIVTTEPAVLGVTHVR